MGAKWQPDYVKSGSGAHRYLAWHCTPRSRRTNCLFVIAIRALAAHTEDPSCAVYSEITAGAKSYVELSKHTLQNGNVRGELQHFGKKVAAQEITTDAKFPVQAAARLLPTRFPYGIGGIFGGTFEPACKRHLLLRVKRNALCALNVQIAEERFVPAGEREPGHRRRHADVDADHSGVEVPLELPGRPTAAGENAGSVAVLAVAAQFERVFECCRANDGEDRAEDFFLRQSHAGLHLIDDARAEQKSVLRQITLTAIECHIRAFLSGDVEIRSDFLPMLGRNNRAHVDIRAAIGRTDFHFRADIDQTIDERVADFSDRHGETAGHAAFAGAAERGRLNGFDCLIQIGIGHDDEMVLRAAGGLHSLAVRRAGGVNVLGNCGAADKRNRSHQRMREQGVDAFLIAVDDVEHALGQPGFHQAVRPAARRRAALFLTA